MEENDKEKLRLALYHMCDSRRELLRRFSAGKPTYGDVVSTSRFVVALRDTVLARRRTEIRGLGVFEWRPCSRRIPTGRRVRTWRLVFRFCQGRKYSPARGKGRK
jgi:hypothetical protein